MVDRTSRFLVFHSAQRFTVRFFSAFRRLSSDASAWIYRRPALASWFFPSDESSRDADYREHNGRMFANFHEQERMLADQPRMNFYATAIERHICRGDRVIDLGTGTGILAALASRAGAARVYAIDHSEILTHARSLAAANKIENVEFHGVHSSEFSVDQRVDVILHEQMGDGLFDEGMVANVSDLRDRLLKPGGLILPSKFELYCEPIKIDDARLVPFIWELKVKGYDYRSLEKQRPEERSYYNLASTDRSIVDYFLGDPSPLLSVDLNTIREADLPHEIVFRRTIMKAGRLDGFAVYFRTFVDHDLLLSSAPLDPGRAPHWGFRILRTDREQFELGDEIEVHLSVGHWPDFSTWRWTYEKLA